MRVDFAGLAKIRFHRRFVLLSIVIVWTLLFLFHNHFALSVLLRAPGGPFSREGLSRFLQESIITEASPLLLLIAIGTGGWGIGLYALELLRIEPRHLIDHAMALALGIGSLATGMFWLGLAKGFYRSAILAYVAIALGWGLLKLGRRAPRLKKPDLAPFQDPLWAVLGGSIVLYALWHGLVIALAPILPSDATVYHLCLPRLYLEAHRVYGIPWNIFSAWPHLMEMLYALPVSLGIDRTAPLIHWLMNAALAAAVFLVGRTAVDERVGWIATIFLVCQPTFLNISGAAYVDGALGLFAFLSMYALWAGIRDSSPSWVIAAGFLSGMAAATKLLGAITPFLLTVWIIWRLPKGRKTRTAVLFLIPILIVVGPWYLKTWVTTGNPVWPFLPRLFSDRHGSSAETEKAFWTMWQPGSGLSIYLSQVSAVPKAPNWAGDIFRPFLLLSLVAFLLRSRWPPIMGYWFFPVLPYLALLHPESDYRRYLAPLWGQMYLWNAWVLNALSRRNRILSVMALVVVLSMASPIWQVNEESALLALSQWRPPVGLECSAEEFYFATEAPYVLVLKKMDLRLGPTDKVLLIHECHAYYLTHRYEFAFSVGRPATVFRKIKNAEEFAQTLRSQGFTHALIRDYPDNFRDVFFDEHYRDIVSGLELRYANWVLSGEQRHLYKLDFSSLPRKL